MKDIFINFFTNIHSLSYIVAYLVGGIPFGMILAKYFANVDIQKNGSGSIGATNVLRVVKESDTKLAKKLAIATILFDAGKGAILVGAGYLLGISVGGLWMIGIMAILGHCFSPYLNFEGGKGVATSAGVLFCFLPLEMLIAVFVWLLAGKFLKISSLSSLLALLALFVSSFIIHTQIPYINSRAPLILICIIIVYKHIPNIKRIIQNEEQKVV